MEDSSKNPYYDYNYYAKMGYNVQPPPPPETTSNEVKTTATVTATVAESETPTISTSSAPIAGYPANMTPEQYYSYYAGYYQYYNQYCSYYNQQPPPATPSEATNTSSTKSVSTTTTMVNTSIPPPIYYPPYYPPPVPTTTSAPPLPPSNSVVPQLPKPAKPRVSRFQSNSSTATPVTTQNKTSIWPEPLKNYVQRAFSSVPDKYKDKMQDLLKDKLEVVYRDELVQKIDWDKEPLPEIAELNSTGSNSTSFYSTAAARETVTSSSVKSPYFSGNPAPPAPLVHYEINKPVVYSNHSITRGRGRGRQRTNSNQRQYSQKLSRTRSSSSSSYSSRSTSKKHKQQTHHHRSSSSSSRSSYSSRSGRSNSRYRPTQLTPNKANNNNRKRTHSRSSTSPSTRNTWRPSINSQRVNRPPNKKKFSNLPNSQINNTQQNNPRNNRYDKRKFNNSHIENEEVGDSGEIIDRVGMPNSGFNITFTNNNAPTNTNKRMNKQQRKQFFNQNKSQISENNNNNAVENTVKLAERASRFKAHLSNEDVAANPNELCGVDGAEEWDETDNSQQIIGTNQNLEKRYLRLTRAPLSSEVRPPEVLVKSLEHITQLWYRDHVEYRFICEQMKSIRQDLTVQCIRDSFTLSVYKQHATIALEACDHQEFNQCQSQIKLLYEEGVQCDQIAEFTAYRLLYYMFTRDFLNINTTLATIELDASLKQMACTDPNLSFAIKLRKLWATNDYYRFFVMLSDDQVPKLCRSIVNWFVDRQRKAAFKSLCKSYRPHLEVEYISRILGYTDQAEMLTFVTSLVPQGTDPTIIYPNNDVSTQKFDMKSLFNTLPL